MMFDYEKLIDRSSTGACKWERRPDDIFKAGYTPLSIADMEFAVAPSIKAALFSAVSHGIYGYTDPDMCFYRAIIDWMERRHQLVILQEWIVCTGGVVPAIQTAIRAFTQPGDKIIIQTPVYYPFSAGIRANDRVVSENSLVLRNGIYEIDFDDLRQKAKDERTRLMVLCSPHNPVGRVWSREELLEVGKICIESDVLMVSDEIHFDIVFPPNKHIVLASLGQDFAQNSIICTSTSKSFNLAGLNHSNIIIPNPSIRKLFKLQLRADGFSNINYFALPANIAAYTQGEAWLENMLEYVYENYLYFCKILEKHFPEVKIFPLEGTYLAWTDWRAFGLDEHALEGFMLKAGLVLDQGYIFGTGGTGFERWNLAVPKSVLEDSLNRLCIARGKAGY